MGGFNSKSLTQKWQEVRKWAYQDRPWSEFQIEYVKKVHNSKKKDLAPTGAVTNEHAVVRSRIIDRDRKMLYSRLKKEIARSKEKKY